MVAPESTPVTPVPRATALNCTACGASIELRAQGWAVSVVCGSCGAQLDATDEQLRILRSGEKVAKLPAIPLGTRGTWHGARWEVIGYQVVSISVEGQSYSWREYVCFNPYRGFLYLSEYDGHWNVIEKLRRRPERESSGAHPTVTLQGVTYKHFQTASGYTTAALGEFPWELRVGDHVVSRDFVAPPFLLSAEASGNEVTWSQGTYTPPEVIQKAFGLPSALRVPVGVFANQPNPHTKLSKHVVGQASVATALLVVMLFLNVLLAGDRAVFTKDFVFDRSTESAVSVTEPFTLDGRPSAVAIDVNAPLNNDWIFLTLSLINETTGDTREVTRQVSYYSGTDSDGRWTEGDQSESVRIASVPAGKYFLRVQAEGGEPGVSSASYNLRVRRDPPYFVLYLVALVALLLPALLVFMMMSGFETRRWAESDHAPVSSTGSDDDE